MVFEALVQHYGITVYQAKADKAFECLRKYLFKLHGLYVDYPDDLQDIRMGIQLTSILRNLSQMDSPCVQHAWVSADDAPVSLSPGGMLFADRLRQAAGIRLKASRWKQQAWLSLQIVLEWLEVCGQRLEHTSVLELLRSLEEILRVMISHVQLFCLIHSREPEPYY